MVLCTSLNLKERNLIDSPSKIRGIKTSFLMRKLLVPLLAVLALPTAVNARYKKESS